MRSRVRKNDMEKAIRREGMMENVGPYQLVAAFIMKFDLNSASTISLACIAEFVSSIFMSFRTII
jgi:hypothetical protein